MTTAPEPSFSLAQVTPLLELSPLPSWFFDEETFAFLAVNAAAVAAYGWSREEFLGMRLGDIRPPADVARLAALQLNGITPVDRPNLWVHRLRNGAERVVQIVSSPLRLDGRRARLVHALDVTDRMRLEELFREAQKMEPLGLLASGIAHDFNNVLTAVLGHASFLLEDISLDDPRREDVAEIARAGQRAAALTRHLLSFSRKRGTQPTVLDLDQEIRLCASLLRRVLPAGVRVEAEASEQIVCARLDAGQLEQILLNLVLNARDALPHGGRISVRARLLESLAPVAVRTGAPLPPGTYAVLEVEDNGTGMPEGVFDRLFEPFFTTKADGAGTGLGLASVRQLVGTANGGIAVESTAGVGTRFRVFFPASPERPFVASDVEALDVRGSGMLLLCEDDPAVATYIARSLRRLGYEVEQTTTSAAARSVMRARGATVRALISDLILPDGFGHDLAADVQSEWPALRVVLITGSASEDTTGGMRLPLGAPLLRKPFTPRALATVLLQVLRK